MFARHLVLIMNVKIPAIKLVVDIKIGYGKIDCRLGQCRLATNDPEGGGYDKQPKHRQ